MATITKRSDGYHIMVSCGYDIKNRQIRKCMTWNPEDGMTEKQIEKAVNEAAVLFEDQVRKGQVLDGKQKFMEFVERWLSDYAEKQLAPKTVLRYRQFLTRILPAIGHIRLDKLQPQHLIEFYSNLAESGIRRDKSWTAKPALLEKLKNLESKRTVFAREAKLGTATLDAILSGRPVTYPTAERLSRALGLPMSRVFEEKDDIRTLSSRTILHYHRLISSILNTAKFWQVIPSNPAQRVKPPKVNASKPVSSMSMRRPCWSKSSRRSRSSTGP